MAYKNYRRVICGPEWNWIQQLISDAGGGLICSSSAPDKLGHAWCRDVAIQARVAQDGYGIRWRVWCEAYPDRADKIRVGGGAVEMSTAAMIGAMMELRAQRLADKHRPVFDCGEEIAYSPIREREFDIYEIS